MTSFPSIVDLLGVPFFRPPVFFPNAMRLNLKIATKIIQYLRPRNLSLTNHFQNMSILGGAIGAGLGAFGSIFGGLSASKAMKRYKQNLEQQRKKNQDWYDRRYNEDATQRADAQAIMSRTEDSIRNRNRRAAGTQAVMGGTDETLAATKAANNEALATATTNIAVNGEARKDAIEGQYLQTDANIDQQLNDIEKWKAGQISQASQGVVKAGSNIAGIL